METFGERLIEFRKNKSYSQSQFAELMEIQRQALLRYEKNIIKPSFEFITKLTILFPNDVNYLLTGTYQNNENLQKTTSQNHFSEKEIEMCDNYRELDEDDQEIFYLELKVAAAKARKRTKELNAL
jgi:transcriptional regulator with XRE-family HTH domain